MNSNQQHNTIYRPYCYLIGWSKLNKFYYGVRYSRRTNCLYKTGCHPDDFWITYFTSSRRVKEYRSLYGEPDIIQIRKTFQTAQEAKKWEAVVLRRVLFNNRTRGKFINVICGSTYVLDDDARAKISATSKGRKHSEETRLRMSEAKRQQYREKPHWRIGRKGTKLHSEETKKKISESVKRVTKENKKSVKLYSTLDQKIYAFESHGDLIRQFGIDGNELRDIQNGGWLIKKRSAKTKHPFKKGDVVKEVI